jgi:hypothetical protein
MQKTFLWLGVLFMGVLVSTAAFALDPMGPPAATIDKGGWGIGLEYSYSDMEIERQPTNWSSAQRNADITMHRVYGNLSYGISENVTGFVRAGGATLEWDRMGNRYNDWEGDDGNWDFAWGAGVKATLSESGDTTWGFVGQIGRSELTGSQRTSDGDKGDWEIIFNEVQIAFGPTWKASDTVRIYGGPFFDFISGRWQDEWTDGDKPRKPIEEEGFWGGYLGAAIDLSKNACLNVEGSLVENGWSVATGVIWRCK